MRKLYILRPQEDDGALLDALEARGLTPDDIANPDCPTCGAATYLGYTSEDSFTLITWDCLDEEDEQSADGWFLVCSEPACGYEEQVERVLDPHGAETFDLERSERELDEFIGWSPAGHRQVLEFLNQVQEESPSRKLECLVSTVQWRCDEAVDQIRQWLKKLPVGKRIRFVVDDESLKGNFLAATDQGFLARTSPGGELLAVPVESLSSYGPQYFDPKKEDPEEPDLSQIDGDRLIMIHGGGEYVVVRGHHLRLTWTEERFGIYSISCRDEAIARELGLRQAGAGFWEGWSRRHEIEARYDIQRLVKVRGHWLVKWGESQSGKRPAVYTEDPAVAAELGLHPVRGYRMDDRPEEEIPIANWSGTVDPSAVEEYREMRIYHWPIPDAAMPGPGD